ncbi:hypothetical protein LTR64_008631 [Lithohypha guttulata]|uniref:uncharacterized protein n=1 Tax=Lithohypha guttulata TaxID=1690604 RepID=UPI002DDE36D7|nr:hypothetical protein LTR51_008762 [Lithohypha guttulata]
MDHLIGSNPKRMGLLSLLIDSTVELISQEDTQDKRIEQTRREPLLILFNGATGARKTATVKAIAELNKRPLVSVGSPIAGTSHESMRMRFSQMLENARSWRALVADDNATFALAKNKPQSFLNQAHVATDFATLLEHFQGVFLLVKRDGQHLVHSIMRQVRAHLKFEEFGNKRMEKIWHSLLKGGDVSWKICNSAIREISEWQLNGHEIEHLF